MDHKKIWILRHGQTDYNLHGIVQGSGVDSHLNERGLAQAKAFYEAYSHIPFDKIYTSSLIRTRESVQAFIESGIAHEPLPGLNEICWGRKEGHKITVQEDAYYYSMLAQWQMGNTSLKIEEGESPDDVLSRLASAMDFIFAKPEEKNVLVCMHGRAMRILLCHLLDVPLRFMDFFGHENLCLYKIHAIGRECRIEEHCNTHHLRALS